VIIGPTHYFENYSILFTLHSFKNTLLPALLSVVAFYDSYSSGETIKSTHNLVKYQWRLETQHFTQLQADSVPQNNC